jgi:hypothetical protein
MLAVDGSGEEEAGYVDAGNEQEDGDSPEKKIEGVGEAGLEHFIEGHDADAEIFGISARILVGEVFEDWG